MNMATYHLLVLFSAYVPVFLKLVPNVMVLLAVPSVVKMMFRCVPAGRMAEALSVELVLLVQFTMRVFPCKLSHVIVIVPLNDSVVADPSSAVFAAIVSPLIVKSDAKLSEVISLLPIVTVG